MSLIQRIKRHTLFIPLALFLIAFVIYNSNLRNLGTTDTITNENLAEEIAIHQRIHFDIPFEEQYEDYEEKPGRENIETQATSTFELDGKHYSKYPILTPVLASPLYLIKLIKPSIPNRFLGKLFASALVAASAGIMYSGLSLLTTKRRSILITFIYGFASSTWVVSSQALWQHGTSQLFSSIAIVGFILLWKGNSKFMKRYLMIIAVSLGLAVWARASNLIFLPIFFFAIWLAHGRKHTYYFTAAASIPVLLLFLFNYITFGDILSTGYTQEAGSGWTNPFLRGFLGLLFSPSVGIFIFSPVFIFTLFSPFLLKPYQKTRGIFITFMVICAAQLLIYSKWWAWYGDSWAYRMLTDALPFWSVLFLPLIDKGLAITNMLMRYVLIGVFGLALLFSVYVELMGAFGLDYSWHDRFGQGVNAQDEYLFNLRDSQIIYYLKRQRYSFTYPTLSLSPPSFQIARTTYVVGDTYGSQITFGDDRIIVSGENKYLHAVELGSGVSPTIVGDALHLNDYYDGIVFNVTPESIGKELKILINATSGENLIIKEIQNGRIVEETIIELEQPGLLQYEIKESPEEIRIQNGADEDDIKIELIEIAESH